MRDIESALLETERFAQSHALGQLDVEEDPQRPDSVVVVAGMPAGDPEFLLEQWLMAAILALPGASVEDVDLIETDRWSHDPVCAAQIRLAFD